MIKHAKAGDIIYELDYNNIDKTCEILEHVVSTGEFDYRQGEFIYFKSKDAVFSKYAHYSAVYKSPKAAHKAYLRILANELKNAKRTIDKVETILQQLRDAQAKH